MGRTARESIDSGAKCSSAIWKLILSLKDNRQSNLSYHHFYTANICTMYLPWQPLGWIHLFIKIKRYERLVAYAGFIRVRISMNEHFECRCVCVSFLFDLYVRFVRLSNGHIYHMRAIDSCYWLHKQAALHA